MKGNLTLTAGIFLMEAAIGDVLFWVVDHLQDQRPPCADI